jgi:hypothetical protein
MTENRRWLERRGGVLFGVVFFGMGALIVAYLRFLREPASPPGIDLTVGFWNVFAWVAIIGGALMAIIGILRLTVRRDHLAMDGDRLRFRMYGRPGELERNDVRDVEVSSDGKSVHLHLDVDRPGIRKRAGLADGQSQVSFHGPAYKDGADLPRSVADWARPG